MGECIVAKGDLYVKVSPNVDLTKLIKYQTLYHIKEVGFKFTEVVEIPNVDYLKENIYFLEDDYPIVAIRACSLSEVAHYVLANNVLRVVNIYEDARTNKAVFTLHYGGEFMGSINVSGTSNKEVLIAVESYLMSKGLKEKISDNIIIS